MSGFITFLQRRDYDVETFSSWAQWRRERPSPRRAGTVVLRYLSGPRCRKEIEREVADLAGDGDVALVLLSDTEDVDEILEAIAGGAKGYIPTTLSLDVARGAIDLVRSGGVFIPSGSLLSPYAGKPGDAIGPRQMFTPRQAAVLEAVRHGKANKVIAYELDLKESTVKAHIRNVMRKLGAHNRTELAVRSSYLPGASG
ncbi:LuxR C-terminal-related transcriptional regulator [Bosea sp. 2KB_26]|uniref:helix-turn-helix transcriptional regulator n=1 Tax=Bosea sp. 2KB_26 TaxID=3237475 RepID=UPI003F90AA1F